MANSDFPNNEAQQQPQSCGQCRHLEWAEADSSDGWPDEDAGFICGARNGVDNLKQFPFKNTFCQEFEEGRNEEVSFSK